MGLYNWLRTQVTGVDVDETQRISDEQDEKLAQLNRDALESGQYSQAQYEMAEKHRIDGVVVDAAGQVGEAFIEGAKEGLAREQELVKGAVNGVAKGILGFIPWWVFVVAIIALFLYLGGGNLVRRKIAEA